MSERIKNGNFSSGFNYWDNGVGGGNAFTLDSGKAKGSSYEDSISVKIYKIRQQFEANDEAIIAKISAWGQWEALSGNNYDGYNEFKIELKKPDMSMVELLNVRKTALTGSGQLLDEVDIKSNFDQYGNYELWLTLRSRAKRDNKNTSVSEPYADWTNGGDLFSLYDGNNKIERSSGGFDENEYIATMTKQFTVDEIPYSAPLTVQAKGKQEVSQALAQAEVKIRKVGLSWTTLYSQELDGDSWSNILNGVDVSSYITSPGTWEIQLKATVQSKEFESVYYKGEIHFGNVDFTANWHEYTRSYGWYDDISLEMSVKKYKAVTEAIGASGKLQGVASITESEIIQMAESIKKFPKIKRFLESVGIAETYEAFAGRKAEVKEILAVLEAYLKKAKISKSESVAIAESYEILSSFNVEIKEILQLVESYSKKVIVSKAEAIGISEAILAVKQKIKNIREAVKISEFIAAKRTHGNLETTYTMGVPIEWTELEKQQTQWITKKVEISQ